MKSELQGLHPDGLTTIWIDEEIPNMGWRFRWHMFSRYKMKRSGGSPFLIVVTERKYNLEVTMKTILKIAGLVLLAMYFCACGHLTLADDPLYMTSARVREAGNRTIKDEKYYPKVAPILTEKFLNSENVDDVIEIKITN